MSKLYLSAVIIGALQTPVFAGPKENELAALQTLIAKFSISMLGIVVFSLVIFLGLSFYNRFFVSQKIKTYTLKENSLKSPESIEEALYMFIEKNKLV